MQQILAPNIYVIGGNGERKLVSLFGNCRPCEPLPERKFSKRSSCEREIEQLTTPAVVRAEDQTAVVACPGVGRWPARECGDQLWSTTFNCHSVDAFLLEI